MLETAPKAILFDVDGTLYRQSRLRRAMLLRLLRAHALAPAEGLRTLRCLRAYRAAQEALRHAPEAFPAHRQAQEAALRTGVPLEQMEGVVRRWMEEAPLPLLRPCRRPGLTALLERARASGIRLGVFSDYPPEEKLEHLEVDGWFDVVVSAQDPQVGVFKPHPRGIEVALRRLDVSPGEALYVGDRVEVDAAAARAAGVSCVILARDSASPQSPGYRVVRDFPELDTALFG